MHPIRSIRRVAVGAALAGAAIGAVPALASASTCTFDPKLNQATVVDASGVNQLRVFMSFGNLLTVRDGGNPPTGCVGGGSVASTTNTDRIQVFAAAKGASDGVILDESGGAFAPGVLNEADGHSEIEMSLFGKSGHLTVIGTPGADVLRVGGISGLNLTNDEDEDVGFSATDVSLVGGDGPDFLSGQGDNDELGPTPLPLGFSGGAGDDVIFGGVGIDHFAGNAGNDTLHTDDHLAELVNGGPGFDNAVHDGGDVLSNIESEAVGSLKLAPRSVRADARKWAKMTMSWTHPKAWRELRKVEVKLYRGAKLVGTIDVRPRGTRLAARGAVEIMANRSLVSHSAKTVTARLAMRFPRSLAGASLRVAVQATDRQGHKQLDRDAGLIRVAK